MLLLPQIDCFETWFLLLNRSSFAMSGICRSNDCHKGSCGDIVLRISRLSTCIANEPLWKFTSVIFELCEQCLTLSIKFKRVAQE